MTGIEDIKQKAKCLERYKKRDEECSHMSEFDIEREIECGICMEKNPKIALPDCNHAMCLTCYRDWRARSQSCPYCRDSLRRVDSCDLWIFTDSGEVEDVNTITRDNLQRLFSYIDKLPLLLSETVFALYDTYETHLK
jgi:CO dehydrogenase/acetyl-CoA synthase beta subunit